MRDYYIEIFLGGFRENAARKLAKLHNNKSNIYKKNELCNKFHFFKKKFFWLI